MRIVDLRMRLYLVDDVRLLDIGPNTAFVFHPLEERGYVDRDEVVCIREDGLFRVLGTLGLTQG